MDVPQRGIVKARNQRRGNRIHIADLLYLVLRALDVRRVAAIGQEELMADQHVPLVGVQRRQCQQPCKGFGIAQIVAVFLRPGHKAHHARPHERQQIEIHRTEIVRQGDALDGFALLHGRIANHVDAAVRQFAAEDIEPLRAVVVAGNQHDFAVRERRAELRHEVVEQRNRFDRRHGTIVNIPRENNGIGLILPGQRDDFIKNCLLIFQQVMLVELDAQMEVGQMEKAHRLPPFEITNFC